MTVGVGGVSAGHDVHIDGGPAGGPGHQGEGGDQEQHGAGVPASGSKVCALGCDVPMPLSPAGPGRWRSTPPGAASTLPIFAGPVPTLSAGVPQR